MWVRFAFVALCLSASGGLYAQDDGIILRGDANNDADVTSADVDTIMDWLYSSGDEPPCLNQADANNDGLVDSSDAVYLSQYVYQNGYPPPAPGDSGDCETEDLPYPGCKESMCST